MKNKIAFLLIPIALALGIYLGNYLTKNNKVTILTPTPTPVPTPLAAYTIDALKNSDFSDSEFTISPVPDTYPKLDKFLGELTFRPNPTQKSYKKTTGLIHIPSENGQYPIIIMIRGYVDQSIYQTGVGTKNAGEYFANNGFITIAPDFLGYAGSDPEAGNIFETRFQTYTTLLSLIKALDTMKIPTQIKDNWDKKNIFIWAHSNGGQIALTTLAISGKSYPTTLWAPVTKPFPYSVLYYTDESADQGKFIRQELAKFEQIYDVTKYSFTNYLEDIKAPIQIHQGTADDAIPVSWSQSIVSQLKKLEVTATLKIYPGADHNLRPNWNEIVADDVAFFNKNLLK